MNSPPPKRIKLELFESPTTSHGTPAETPPETQADDADPEDGEHCSICLQPYTDRTMVPTCSHEFCFECLLIWTGLSPLRTYYCAFHSDGLRADQSRRCPLCAQDIGQYLMHNIRSKYDYQKHYLAPLRTSPKPQAVIAARADARRRAERRREIEWGRRRRRDREEADDLERAVEKRKWVYRNGLYAKVSISHLRSGHSANAAGHQNNCTRLAWTHTLCMRRYPSLLTKNGLDIARRVKHLHEIPSISHSLPIHGIARLCLTRDNIYSTGINGMAWARRRG